MLRFLFSLCEVLCIAATIGGCGDTDVPLEYEVRDAGLQASAVPPLGEGIVPIAGGGGDGSPVVTAVGGWSGGPGAVRWHGGQWVMPYSEPPGATLQNVSCDIWNPTTSAPASVLVEVVSSNGQVLGSATAPASTTAVIRAWPFVGTHAVTDGEQIVVRLSPRDATTGAWTTGAQDTTVIGCAANSTGQTTTSVTLSAGNNPNPAASDRINLSTSGGFPFINGISGGRDGRSVTLVLTSMLSSSGQVTFSRLDGSSTQDDQLIMPFFNGEPELTMDRQDESVTFVYDLSVRKWRLVSKNF